MAGAKPQEAQPVYIFTGTNNLPGVAPCSCRVTWVLHVVCTCISCCEEAKSKVRSSNNYGPDAANAVQKKELL